MYIFESLRWDRGGEKWGEAAPHLFPVALQGFSSLVQAPRGA